MSTPFLPASAEISGLIIVLSKPSRQAPPSTIIGISPDNSFSTALAEVGLILPNLLALGAAMGRPSFLTIAFIKG